MRRRQLLGRALGSAATLVLPGRLRAQAVRRLVLVHGRGQGGRSSETLSAEWMAALERGAQAIGRRVPAGLEVACPFYGDQLDRFTAAFDLPLTSDVQARGVAPDREFLEFQAAFGEALARRAGVGDAEIEAEYGADPAARGPQNWRWVQAILRALDKKSPALGQGALEAFTRDVFLYLHRSVVREAIDATVRAALADEPMVIVAHSLGTVVAYNVLRSDAGRRQVPLLVTLGSPLAVRAVREPLRPIARPERVARWVNAFDPRDVVSLYPLDGDNFPVSPAVENHAGVRNHTDNRHGIVGYLDDAEVARRVLDALG